MDSNFYSRLALHNSFLSEDEFLLGVESSLLDFYDSYLYGKEGYHIDEDTSYTTYISGEVADGMFYCSVMLIEFEYVDEMNQIVSQSLRVELSTGNTTINDDDNGCVYKQTINEFCYQ